MVVFHILLGFLLSIHVVVVAEITLPKSRCRNYVAEIYVLVFRFALLHISYTQVATLGV